MGDVNYKKQKKQTLKEFETEIIKFTEDYFYKRVKELNIDAKLTLITSSDNHKKLKLLDYTDTMNMSTLGTCNEKNEIKINISNYVIRSLYFKNKELNFAILVGTINHELSHASDNFKKKELTIDDYKILKFLILEELSPKMYDYYYKNLEGEQKAYQAGYSEVLKEFQNIEKFKPILSIYEEKLKEIKNIKATQLYDEANIEAVDNTFKENANNKFFIDNYNYLKYEYNEDGSKKNLDEIIKAKDKIITDELFNYIAYNSFLNNNVSKEDLKQILEFGINYENNRLIINEANALSKAEKRENEEYLLKRLKKMQDALRGEEKNGQFYRK